MQKQMVSLLEKLNMDITSEFENAKIKSIKVSEENQTWFFNLFFESVLSCQTLKTLIAGLRSFKDKDVLNVEFEFEYGNPLLTLEKTQDYWNCMVQFSETKKGRVASLKNAKTEFGEGTVSLYAASHIQKEVFIELSEIVKNKLANIGLSMMIDVFVDETMEKVEEIIQKEQDALAFMELRNEVVEKKEEVVVEDEEKKKEESKFKKNERRYNKIDVELTPISAIPLDDISLMEFKQKEGHATFAIEGEVFECEIRELRGGVMLLEAKITDFDDSIVFKRFLRTLNERDFYNEVVQVGKKLKVEGLANYDMYARDIVILAEKIEEVKVKKSKSTKRDKVDVGLPRVELHVHTKMSTQDGVTSIEDFVKLADSWGHKAIALTDHAGVYAFPDLDLAIKDNKLKIKPIYGVEANFIDEDSFKIALDEQDIDLINATYVIYDVETTGFSTEYDDIIEIGAVKIQSGRVVDEFSQYVNPHRLLNSNIMNITSIKNEDLKDAPDISVVLPKFKEFCEGCILVAHNATFDMGHLYKNFEKLGIQTERFPVIDTLQLARIRYADRLKRFNLKAVSKLFKVELTQHHRAIYDAKATAEVFLHMINDLREAGIRNHNQINSIIDPDEAFRYVFPRHATLLVQNKVGLKNLYKIISDSHTTHFHNDARVLKSVLEKYRKGILVGSSCYRGDLFETALNKPYEELKEKAKYYDYIEVQPPSVYAHLIESSKEPKMQLYIEKTIKRLVDVGDELGIPVVATGDVHHLTKDDKLYREIYIRTNSVGGGRHPLAGIDKVPSQHLMTTNEMLEEFLFLGEQKALEIVVDNSNKIASMIKRVTPFPDELFTPRDNFLEPYGIASMKETLKEKSYARAFELYGNPLPKYVEERLAREVEAINGNGYASVYYISHMLVKNSIEAGYVVGSRGSVGSSFVATMMGITEVNPLSPHYRCPECQYSVFKMNEDDLKSYPHQEVDMQFVDQLNHVESGYDLPNAICPHCGTKMKKDGHDIPFETFMGFEGNKVPDIDLNFSGEYQGIAHEFTREIFGKEHAFRAGTISTVAEKTAFGYVRGYLEDNGIVARNAEISRIAKKVEGTKRTTGQHPGGIIVVPDYKDIYDITPVQFPSDDVDSSWKTSHFDYHKFEDNLLKLDILGHDDPTVLRHLMDYVDRNPDEFSFSTPEDIPLDDENVYKLFLGTQSIGVNPVDLKSEIASYGVPEFGTPFVREMLKDTKPKSFAQLVKISGLSHGTDVWLNNAQDLVLGNHPEFPSVDFSEIIGCRDDIMVYLTYKGLEPSLAFKIMESVRKGKGLTPEWADEMRRYKVPEWYIWSCKQIKYMFPKAHATAYVLMAMRIAWFKVNKPMYYYSAYFSKRASQFDARAMIGGKEAILQKMEAIEKLGFEASATEKSLYTVLEVSLEMILRGFSFKPIDVLRSEATEFIIDPDDDTALILPFIALDGLGENVAQSIVDARNEKEFISKDDIKTRTRINTPSFDALDLMGAFDAFPETSQMSLFTFNN